MNFKSFFPIFMICITQAFAFQVSKDSIYSPVFTNDAAYLISTISVNPGVSQEIIDSIKYTDTNETVIPDNCGVGSFNLQLTLEGKALVCPTGSNCLLEANSCFSEKTGRYAKDTLRIGKPKKLTIATMGSCVALCPLIIDTCSCHGCPNKVNAYGKLILYSRNGIKKLYLIGTSYQCGGGYKNPLGASVIRQSSRELKLPVDLNQILFSGRLYINNKDVAGKLNPGK